MVRKVISGILLVIQFKVHAIVNFVISKCDVVFEDGVPLLENDLIPSGASLRGDKLLQVSHSVVRVALHAHLFAQPIIARHLDHRDHLHVDNRNYAG